MRVHDASHTVSTTYLELKLVKKLCASAADL